MVYYDANTLANLMIYGMVGNWIIGRLKTSAWLPFINKQTFWLNRGVTILIATISAIGIEHSYSYTPEGVFTLTLTGVTLWSVVEHAKQWLVAYFFQQIPYHLATKEVYNSKG